MRTRLQTASRLLVAVAALAGMAYAGAAATTTDAAGLRNCVEIPEPPQSGRVGCYELVWSDGAEYRMVFSNQHFRGATPGELDPFYVLAPQTDQPQGYPPNTFPHDHVVRAIPAGNGGTYSTKLQGFFVLCSAAGITSGACVPAFTSVGAPVPLPLAVTVNGQPLTSTEAIESAAEEGHLFLQNLGPTAVIVGTISGQ